jgi:hypothetical protein
MNAAGNPINIDSLEFFSDRAFGTMNLPSPAIWYFFPFYGRQVAVNQKPRLTRQKLLKV